MARVAAILRWSNDLSLVANCLHTVRGLDPCLTTSSSIVSSSLAKLQASFGKSYNKLVYPADLLVPSRSSCFICLFRPAPSVASLPGEATAGYATLSIARLTYSACYGRELAMAVCRILSSVLGGCEPHSLQKVLTLCTRAELTFDKL